MSDSSELPASRRALWGLSAAVYVRREGKILILKRAVGEATGGWFIPGGAVEAAEDVETAARRELFEETGLRPDGELTLIDANHLFVYGGQALQLCYACDCAAGDVVISDEHSGARWIDPVEYRDRYFRDEVVEQVQARDPHLARMMLSVRRGLDRYIEWRPRRAQPVMSVEMYLVRDGKMLMLRRASGRGRGFWMSAGGAIDPGEHPEDAAIREAFEETGLRVERPQLMYIYRDFRGVDVFRAAYVAAAPPGDVVLSYEHTDHRWLTPDEYVARYCSERAGDEAPEYAEFFRQLRENCARVKAWIASSS